MFYKAKIHGPFRRRNNGYYVTIYREKQSKYDPKRKFVSISYINCHGRIINPSNRTTYFNSYRDAVRKLKLNFVCKKYKTNQFYIKIKTK